VSRVRFGIVIPNSSLSLAGSDKDPITGAVGPILGADATGGMIIVLLIHSWGRHDTFQSRDCPS